MIQFINGNKYSIELSTNNYEFPNSEDTDFDGNWLNINIKIIENNQEWKTIFPFLLTSDWKDIYKWFDDISNFRFPQWKDLSFIEPNIEFQLVHFDKNIDLIEFDIQLSLECIPDFHKDKKNIKYRFELNSKECKTISELCKIEYNKFPERKAKQALQADNRDKPSCRLSGS